jgi:hypothetical protein
MHRCGHRVEWDLSRKHPDNRAGYARWLALRDCTSCWWAQRRNHQAPTIRRTSRRPSATRLDAWEHTARMPRLSGGAKAVAWARQIRRHLLTEALPPSAQPNKSTDEAVVALVGHAQAITTAAWWIDHRRLEPGHLAFALDKAVTQPGGGSTRR